MAALDLLCMQAFSSCKSGGYSPAWVHRRPLQGFSYGAQASGLAGFRSCSSQALEHVGSVAVALRLSCLTACGIFPAQGSNPCLLPWQVDSFPCTTREVQHVAHLLEQSRVRRTLHPAAVLLTEWSTDQQHQDRLRSHRMQILRPQPRTPSQNLQG